ncbi:hypothetical protein GCM10008098_02880 [Rhodanobacter panaciterrae]|uniref:Uncharacterized protein n=1 Tax=Rhodanobacter panaciterrae TaxID=490572 RepID=A0ABQ2ZJN2_9GAMM|nr:hypothetical protein GCM10008098_02880 [Rhodanobacter panaciterrae]
MAGDFGVGGDFLDGGQMKLAEAHAGNSGVMKDAHCSGLLAPSLITRGAGREAAPAPGNG